MDQTKADKFAELSPVLELVYVMLTNMAKYMDVYATDIEAEQTAQYVEAKDALKIAISKFDVLYGLKSASSTPETVAADLPPVQKVDETVAMPVAPEVTQTQPYDFASGSDPDSLKKAKQAVEELKTLFADMKKQEAAGEVPMTPIAAAEPAAVAEVVPQVAAPAPMPTFVTPPAAPQVDSVSAPVSAPATVPTPMNTPTAPAQDATEIDSILAELKKLQNKGTQQL